MYHLLDTGTGKEIEQARELLYLWVKLDHHTAKGIPVIITDDKDEIRGGNLLGYQSTIHLGKMTMERIGAIK